MICSRKELLLFDGQLKSIIILILYEQSST